MNYLTSVFWNCLDDYIKKSKCQKNGIKITAYTTFTPLGDDDIKIVVETEHEKYPTSISMREMEAVIEKIAASEGCNREDIIQYLCDEMIRKVRKMVTFAYVASI